MLKSLPVLAPARGVDTRGTWWLDLLYVGSSKVE